MATDSPEEHSVGVPQTTAGTHSGPSCTAPGTAPSACSPSPAVSPQDSGNLWSITTCSFSVSEAANYILSIECRKWSPERDAQGWELRTRQGESCSIIMRGEAEAEGRRDMQEVVVVMWVDNNTPTPHHYQSLPLHNTTTLCFPHSTSPVPHHTTTTTTASLSLLSSPLALPCETQAEAMKRKNTNCLEKIDN